jgi:hypothetical protein
MSCPGGPAVAFSDGPSRLPVAISPAGNLLAVVRRPELAVPPQTVELGAFSFCPPIAFQARRRAFRT